LHCRGGVIEAVDVYLGAGESVGAVVREVRDVGAGRAAKPVTAFAFTRGKVTQAAVGAIYVLYNGRRQKNVSEEEIHRGDANNYATTYLECWMIQCR